MTKLTAFIRSQGETTAKDLNVGDVDKVGRSEEVKRTFWVNPDTDAHPLAAMLNIDTPTDKAAFEISTGNARITIYGALSENEACTLATNEGGTITLTTG